MGYKSRKALCEALKELGALPQDYDYRKLSNEVYGRDAMIYVGCERPDNTPPMLLKSKKWLQAELEARGFVCRKYDLPTILQVQVSYFKGWHWDE
jgi:hypothetical protein